jgi:hypothetical protein
MVVAVMIGTLLLLILFFALSDEPSDQAIYDRQEQILHQLAYVSCILLIPPDERIPEAVAACQVAPAVDG